MVPKEQLEKIPTLQVDPTVIGCFRYGPEEPPVFFGHYWLTGQPAPIAGNLACLDYSAGKGGQLVAYHWREGDRALCKERFITA